MIQEEASSPADETEPLTELREDWTRFVQRRQDSLVTHFTEDLRILDPAPCQNNLKGSHAKPSPKKVRFSKVILLSLMS